MKWLDLSDRSNDLNAGQSFPWPEMTPQDWLMEICALSGLVAMLAYVAFHYSRLPDMIPVHLDTRGNAEGFGNREQVWILPGISFLLYLIMPQVLRFKMILNSSRFLYRVRTQKQFNGRIRLLRFQKMILIWGFFNLSATTIRLSLHPGTGISAWFFPVFICLLVIPSLSYLIFLKNNP